MCTSRLTHPHGAAGGLRTNPLKQQEPGLGGDRLWTQRAWRCLCSTPHQQGSLFLHGEPFRGSVSPRMIYQTGLWWLQLMKIPCPNRVKEKREREHTAYAKELSKDEALVLWLKRCSLLPLPAHILLGSDLMVASGCWGSTRLVPWCQCRGSHLLVASTEALGFILIGPLTS